MDFPFLHFAHMLTVKRIKETIEMVICEANVKLLNGKFGKKDGDDFRKTLTDQLDILPDNEEITMYLFHQLKSCCFLSYGSDISTLLSIVRYIFSACSLVNFMCEFDDDEGGLEIDVRRPFADLYTTTFCELKEKIIATGSIKQYGTTLTEFYGIALEAYKKGYDAASSFMSCELMDLLSSCRYMEHIHPNPFVDLVILQCKSLDIVKHTDTVLKMSKELEGLNPHQQAQILQLQAEAYNVKDVFSLAIQRGKEARDLYQTDIDKERMKKFVEEMEIKQQEKGKNRKPESKEKVIDEEENEDDSDTNEENKIVVLDDFMEPVIKEIEEIIMKGTLDIHTTQKFQKDMRKYTMDRKQRDEEKGLQKGTIEAVIIFRVVQGLQNMFENLSEDRKVWLDVLRYIFHVVSLIDSACKLDKSSKSEPHVAMNTTFLEIYELYFEKIKKKYLKGMTEQELTVYCEELAEIAKQALEYGHKNCCFFLTNTIVRLYTESGRPMETGPSLLQNLFILHLKSVDISLFPDYTMTISTAVLPQATRKQRGTLYEFGCRALKYKKNYKQALQKAQLSKASFQDSEDKQRVEELIKELKDLELSSRK